MKWGFINGELERLGIISEMNILLILMLITFTMAKSKFFYHKILVA